MIMPFAFGALIYCIAASLTYSDLRTSSYFIPLGLLIGALTNGLWFYIAANTGEKHTLVTRALYWDVMIVAIYAVIPFAFFGVRLPPQTALGAALIVIGIIVTKI